MSKKKNRSNSDPRGPQIKDIMFSGEDMCVVFKDSSRLVVPVVAIEFLADANLQQRCDCHPCDKGSAIAWDGLDKKITLDELLAIVE